MACLLLIEDDELLRGALAATLRHFGHDVVEAGNGVQGLARFEDTHPEIVITDIIMPEKEGLGVMLELRKKKSPAKIIAMTGGGFGTMDYLRTARLMGAALVLRKPFAAEALADAVASLIPAGPTAKPV